MSCSRRAEMGLKHKEPGKMHDFLTQAVYALPKRFTGRNNIRKKHCFTIVTHVHLLKDVFKALDEHDDGMFFFSCLRNMKKNNIKNQNTF